MNKRSLKRLHYKKLLILVGKIGPKNKLFAQLISERIGSETKVVLDTFSNLFIELGRDEIKVLIGGVDIKEFGLIYFRRIDHALFPLSGTLALCLDKLKVKYFDTKFKEIGAGGDKFTSFAKLFLNGITVPKTIFCPRERIWVNRKDIISALGLPIIAKDTKAQGNSGVFLIRKEEDLERLPKEQFLFQEFIDIDNEYRLLVLKNKVAVVHTKVKRGYDNFVVDYSDLTSEIEFINPEDIPNSLREVAIKAAKILGTEIAGVDVCIEKKTGKEIVIEVNRGPGFEYDTVISPEINEVSKFLKKELANG